MLKNQGFETSPVNLRRDIKRTCGTDGAEEAGIEKKKLGVLCNSSPSAFLKRLKINADEKILKNVKIRLPT